MEMLTAIIGHVAWPLTIITLAVLFRREVSRLAARFTKIEYPGGAITLQEVTRLEIQSREVAAAAPSDEILVTPSFSADPNLSLAQTRVDIERELFRLSQVVSCGGQVEFTALSQRVRNLLVDESSYLSFDRHLAAALIQFSEYFERVADDAAVSSEVKTRLAVIGGELLAQVHRVRLQAEFEYDLAGHGLWHMHRHVPDKSKKYYWWSAVAATCPVFNYNYDIYRAAVERHNAKLIDRVGRQDAEREMVELITLDDFIAVLSFRQTELKRVLAAYQSGQDAFSKANEWQWPNEWGQISWTGAVAHGWLRDVDRELMETQAALVRYRGRAEGRSKTLNQTGVKPATISR